MEKIYDYYKKNCEAYSDRINGLKKQIYLYGSIRLAIVTVMLIAIWLLRAESTLTIISVPALFSIPFIILMVYHNRLDAKKTYYENLLKLNQDELKTLDYDFSAFDGASEKISSEHSFSLDLDLFGNHSLYQSINRTVTAGGHDLLADWFMSPLSSKENILARQKAVRELSQMNHLRQDFYVTGLNKNSSKKDRDILLSLSGDVYYFLESRLFKTLLVLIPATWVIILLGCIAGVLNWSAAGIFFAVAFIVAYSGNKQISLLYDSVNKMEKIFNIYSNLMKIAEDQNFESEELKKIKHTLLDNEKKRSASMAVKQLSRYIGGLDQRGSFAGIMLNIFYMRDTRHAILLERWKKNNKQQIQPWIDALATFDAYSSLATFAFNHPDYIYADVADSYFKMEGKGLGHPLLHRDVCINNDIEIAKSPWFLIITGANMAGKSTYLRTIGVNYLLSCMGAPACADLLTIYPANLVTSLRTSDSLASNESYFFAELKRLKMIIDRLHSGEELFIILDEILKGTNSVDKQKGSIALMKQFVSFNTCGIIATHDLQLGELENEFPEQIKNYRFEADIQNNELSFSYKLREGVARNMNASFLMKRMGITLE